MNSSVSPPPSARRQLPMRGVREATASQSAHPIPEPTPPSANAIPELVDDVVRAAKLPPRQRKTPIRPTVDQLAEACYVHGLLEDQLRQVVDLLTLPGYLDQASLGALARNLYPRTRVPSDIVFRVVAALGHGEQKPSLNIQGILVKWLIMVYPLLAESSALGRVYSVFFHLLDTAALRPVICHLLALITRRKHVRPFRIQALLNLSRQIGKDPSVIGLLRVFKDYYPEIIVGDAIRGRASAFKHPDPAWRAQLEEIQETHLRNAQARGGDDDDGEAASTAASVYSGFRARRLPVAKASLIPNVHTSLATEKSVTLEEIDSAEGLAKHLEVIELPDQLVAVIADPLLTKLLQLRPQADANRRISHWITAIYADIVSGEPDDPLFIDTMDVLYEYVRRTKHLAPVVLDIMAKLLPRWNGNGGPEVRDAVTGILSHIPIAAMSFEELHKRILAPLESSILTAASAAAAMNAASEVDISFDAQRSLLYFYRSLLWNWVTSFYCVAQAAAADGGAPSPEAAAASMRVEDVETYARVTAHANRLALALWQTKPGVAAHLAVLDLCRVNASVLEWDVLRYAVRIVYPAPVLVYALSFSPSLAVLSRLSRVLVAYKRGFESSLARMKEDQHIAQLLHYDKAVVNTFNGFLLDICNCWWRGRALQREGAHATGSLFPQHLLPALRDYLARVDPSLSVEAAFGLSFAPAMALQSRLAFYEMDAVAPGSAQASSQPGDGGVVERGRRSTKYHRGPITQKSLTQFREATGIHVTFADYRLQVLRTLEREGFGGITELMKNTMKVLMNKQ